MRLIDADALIEEVWHSGLGSRQDCVNLIQEMPTIERPHGEWEALGFQNGYAFCRCSNCHKTMKLYLDSKNEFCCIADIRKKVVSCMYCGSDNRKEGDTSDADPDNR